jgi:hypothetical protein
MEDEIIPKTVLNGKFLIQEQWENQEQDGRTSSRGTHHRSYEYKDGGDEHKIEKRWRYLLREARAQKEL